MSAFSQAMNDRSEARRIYNQRKRIKQLEENNQSMQEEMARTWAVADNYKHILDKIYEISISNEDTLMDVYYKMYKVKEVIMEYKNGK